MSEKMEYSGADVPQAIANACKDLNVSQDQLKIEVLAAGTTGIFGIIGKKKARISVTDKAKKGKKAAEQRSQNRGKNGRDHKPSRRKPSGRGRSPEKPPAEIGQTQLDDVKADLEKILELMGFPSPVEVSNQANKIHAHIGADHAEEIIGTEGQTLDSIQYLMRKIVSRRIEGKVMFALDAGDYRNQRRQELEARALSLADEVRQAGRTKSIPALNPAERRIVHMTLQDDSTIRSRSVGDGHFKKILIYLPGQGKKKRNR
jgi:spoIIIJ-associated protein